MASANLLQSAMEGEELLLVRCELKEAFLAGLMWAGMMTETVSLIWVELRNCLATKAYAEMVVCGLVMALKCGPPTMTP